MDFARKTPKTGDDASDRPDWWPKQSNGEAIKAGIGKFMELVSRIDQAEDEAAAQQVFNEFCDSCSTRELEIMAGRFGSIFEAAHQLGSAVWLIAVNRKLAAGEDLTAKELLALTMEMLK